MVQSPRRLSIQTDRGFIDNSGTHGLVNLISLIRYELLHSLKGVHSTVHVHDGLTSLIAWGGSEHLH